MLLNKTIKQKVFRLLGAMLSIVAYFFAANTLAATNSATIESVSFNTILNNEVSIVFTLNQPLDSKPDVQLKTDPAAVDVVFSASGFSEGVSAVDIQHADVEDVSIQKFGGKVVATINLKKLKQYKTKLEGQTFTLTLYDNKKETAKAEAATNQEFINTIDGLDFLRADDGSAQFLINLADSKLAVDVSEKLGKIYVEFYNTSIDSDLVAKMDVTDFGTIVTDIESFVVGQNTRFVIETNTNFEVEHEQQNNQYLITIKDGGKPANFLGKGEDYTGRPISLNFQDIAVRTVLQIIADYNGFNLVTTDSVVGNITLRLDGTPWDQALDIILKVKGLDKRMEGNILMVAPSEELAAREAKELQAQQQVTELAPLFSEYIQINYAKAADFAAILKSEETSLLSSRGSVTVDERTNTLLIRDTSKSIEDVRRMIDVLDIPVRQVVIESRMVTVKDNISDELGIRWGVTQNDGDFGSAGTIAGANNASNGVIPSLNDRLNVNLPVTNPAGSLAFQVARLADGTILDLELTALERENKGEIIASPRITTANQKEAYIEQGTEIPYVQAASSGATTVTFKKAILGLKVTPQITPDNRVILDLVITQDTRGDTVNTPTGQAVAIDTQEIGTQVLVNNGETIVLGGIYQQQIINSVSKVPVLGDIPYFGWMFRNTSEFNEKKELLIFVTPRIITDEF